MEFMSQDDARAYVLNYCDDDEEAAALLIEQVRYNIPPMPPQGVLDAVNFLIASEYAGEWSVVG